MGENQSMQRASAKQTESAGTGRVDTESHRTFNISMTLSLKIKFCVVQSRIYKSLKLFRKGKAQSNTICMSIRRINCDAGKTMYQC